VGAASREYQSQRLQYSHFQSDHGDDEECYGTFLTHQAVPGLRLDHELAKLCEDSRAKHTRPGLKRNAAKQGEAMLNRFKMTWENLGNVRFELRITNDLDSNYSRLLSLLTLQIVVIYPPFEEVPFAEPRSHKALALT
jgi:hypothetical protein